MALPIVLVCLVALASILTGLMLTATTELVVSQFHVDAVEDRYRAEGAIAAWIAERDSLLEGADTIWTPPGSFEPVRVVVERLDTTGIDGNWRFAVRAEPVRAGSPARSALAFIRTRPYPPAPFEPNINATVTAGRGGRIEVGWSGTPTIHDRLAGGDAAEHAFLHGSGTSLDLSSPTALEGSASVGSTAGPALTAVTLGHRTHDLAWNAGVRFGRYFNEVALEPMGRRDWGAEPAYSWGCPADLLADLGSPAEPCDSDEWPLIAIDADNSTVLLDEHHGQGMLIVVNGSLHVGGSFVYRGLILVDGNVTFSGGGLGWPASILGAVVASGEVRIFDGRDPTSGTTTSDRRILAYDAIAVERAVTAFQQAGFERWRSRRVQGRVHGRVELID